MKICCGIGNASSTEDMPAGVVTGLGRWIRTYKEDWRLKSNVKCTMESSSSSSSKYMDAMELEDEQKLQVRCVRACVCVRVCARVHLCIYPETAWRTSREHVCMCTCLWIYACLPRASARVLVECALVSSGWVGAYVRARAWCIFMFPFNVQTVWYLSLHVYVSMPVCK